MVRLHRTRPLQRGDNMYENGKRLNRYARKLLHKTKMKRKATPLCYSSFKVYAEDEDKKEWMQLSYWQEKIRNGWKPDHHKWWKPRWDCIKKKCLKEEAREKARSYYREQLAHYDINEDSIQMKKRFGEPWDWD